MKSLPNSLSPGKAPGKYSFFYDRDGKIFLVQNSLAEDKIPRPRTVAAAVLLSYLFLIVMLGKVLTFWLLYLSIPAVFIWAKSRWDNHWITRKRVLLASVLWSVLLLVTLGLCLK